MLPARASRCQDLLRSEWEAHCSPVKSRGRRDVDRAHGTPPLLLYLEMSLSEHGCRAAKHRRGLCAPLGETFGPQFDVYWLIYGNALAMTGIHAKAATSL
jgi:hypothetical protein